MSETTVEGGVLPEGLGRNFTRGFAMAVMVGGIIGVGILAMPGEIATVVRSPVLFMGLWLGGGLFVLLSTAVVAELVGMTDRSGGSYAMVRRAYGPFPGFVIGWVDWLSFVADIALKAVVVVGWIALLRPVPEAWQTPLSVLITSLFALLQIRGVVLGARIQQTAAAAMALLMIGFSLALLFAPPVTSAIDAAPPATGMGAWSLVLASIIISYDGWTFAAYFTGEVRGGSGAVARACIRGVVLVMGIYLFLMAALAFSVPLSGVSGNQLALSRALELAVSPAAATAVVAMAIFILLVHQNLLYLSSPRVLYALAEDGLAIQRARVVARGGNPLAAVFLAWAIAVFLILVGGFYFLAYLCTFFYVSLYLVLIAGVMILRRRRPDDERPYRAWGHPWSTVFCGVVWLLVAAYQTAAQPDTALYALAMVAVSWPVYRYLARRRAP